MPAEVRQPLQSRHPPWGRPGESFYNLPVARRLPALFFLSVLMWASAGAGVGLAQTAAASAGGPAAADIRQAGGRLILVLPFQNRSGQPALNWIGDSFPYTLNQRLASVGFLPISRDDRLYALDHLGLPTDFKPSRATTIKIAQTLDADFVVVGSFAVENPGSPGATIQVQAQVLDVNGLKMTAPLTDSAELARLFDVENAVAWKVAQKLDSHFAVAEQTFLAAAGGVKLSSFENYIRGTSAPSAAERTKRLQTAVSETPNYPAALLALGKEQYAGRQFEEAAATLAKVPQDDRLALEAGFYLGLARFNSARYAEAAAAFAFVASRLPLPEVVNDEGVALSRQQKDAAPLFQQAVAADPAEPDYHFNLGVALFRRGDLPGAVREVQTAAKLRSSDDEATDLLTRLQQAQAQPANARQIVGADGFEPTTRIKRTWSEAGFRQAAFQLDQIRAVQMASLPAAQRAAGYAQQGQVYLGQGLMPEAEQEFQSALAADPRSAPAHAGIAQIRERSGAPGDARAEAQRSIQLAPNVAAYLVLARLDLQANNLLASASDVANALRLEPANSAALGMKMALAGRGQALP